jgi:hypothetical protein
MPDNNYDENSHHLRKSLSRQIKIGNNIDEEET